MADKTDYVKELTPAMGLKIVQVLSKASDDNDYVEFTLSDYGIGKVWNTLVQSHETDNTDIRALESSVTSLTNGVFRVTFAGGTDGEKRSVIIVGE